MGYVYCFDDPAKIFLDGENVEKHRKLEIEILPCSGPKCGSENDLYESSPFKLQVFSNLKSYHTEDYSEENMVRSKLFDRKFHFGDDLSRSLSALLMLKEHYLESTQSKIGNFLPPIE